MKPKNIKQKKDCIDEFRTTLAKMRGKNPTALIEAIQLEYYFGTCSCGKEPKYFNYERTNWMYCSKCKEMWLLGSNIFTSWRNENKKIWKVNYEKHKKYKIIEPAMWNPCIERKK